MVIEEFQRRMLADYFTGVRETLILVPKKNGKSTMLAALALYRLVTTSDADIVIAAASREQALDPLLKQARGFVRRSPELAGRLRVTQREILRRDGAGKIRVLAADVDTADGMIPTDAFVDELHRHRSSELYGLLRDGLGPRDGRMIVISTAGDDETSPLGVMRSAAYRGVVERHGAYRYAHSPEGGFVLHEWALDHGEDRDDMATVKTANPSSWQTVEKLAERHRSPSTTPWQWGRFACGIWEKGEKTAISPVEWASARVEDAIPDGETVTLGVDLGWKWDTTAIVPLAKIGDAFRFGVPVILVPPRDGTSLPVSAVFGAIEDFCRRYRVERVVLDPAADGEHLAQRIEGELDFDGPSGGSPQFLGWLGEPESWVEPRARPQVTAHSQKARPMSEAAQRFTALLREGRLEHPGDDAFTAHVLAAVAKSLPDGSWRFVKDRQPIDALIAASIALSVAIGGPGFHLRAARPARRGVGGGRCPRPGGQDDDRRGVGAQSGLPRRCLGHSLSRSRIGSNEPACSRASGGMAAEEYANAAGEAARGRSAGQRGGRRGGASRA